MLDIVSEYMYNNGNKFTAVSTELSTDDGDEAVENGFNRSEQISYT